MKDTVEVRLLVPRNFHEFVRELAKLDMRTIHNEYIYILLEYLKDKG